MTAEEKSLYDILEDDTVLYGDHTDQYGFSYREADGVNYNQLLALYLGWLIKAIKRYDALSGVDCTYDIHELQGWAELERVYKTKGDWGYSFHDVYHDMYGQSVVENCSPELFATRLKSTDGEMRAEWKMDLCDVEFVVRFGEIADELAREEIVIVEELRR